MWHIFLPSLVASAVTCPTFSCGATNSSESTCESYSNNHYIVSPCEIGLECLFVPSNYSNCQYPPLGTKYPGDYCFSNLDCISGTCKSGKCQGSTGNCKTSADCAPLLYCGPSTFGSSCQSQESVGKTCKTNDQCSNSELCDNSKCVKMFSLSNNAVTYTIWSIGLAPLCDSGYAKNNSNVFTCSEAPMSVSANLEPCPASGVCSSVQNVSTKPCVCAYNGEAYCPMFEGDNGVQSMINKWELLFNYSEGNCSSVNPWSFDCFYALGGTAFNLYLSWAETAYQYLNNTWVLSNNAPYCVENTFLQSYYNILANIESSSTSWSYCPVYVCTDYTTNWSANQCINYNMRNVNNMVKPIYEVASCTSGNTCGVPNASNSTCSATPSITNKMPGDYCASNSECSSSLCVNSRCVGQALGDSCVKYSCNPGLFCNSTSKLCQTNIENYDNCTSSNQCNTYSYCLFGQCIPQYSLSIGEKTLLETPINAYGLSVYCETGFAVKNQTTGNSYCAEAPVSNFTTCNLGQLCYDTTGNYSKACECGYDGNGYCPEFEGDYSLTRAIYYIKKLQNYNFQCESTSGANDNCLENVPGLLYYYYKYYVHYSDYISPAFYIDERTCIVDTFTTEYWKAKNYSPPSSGSCSEYTCSDIESTIGTCQTFSNTTGIDEYIITPCEFGLVCEPVLYEDQTCSSLGYYTRLPGEYCQNDYDCFTVNCQNNACVGLSVGSACTTTRQAAPGTYCTTGGYIVASLNINSKCSSTLQCQNFLLCDGSLCLQYFSLPIGAATDNVDSDGYAPACASAYAVRNITNFVCASPPLSKYDGYIEVCPSIGSCISSNGLNYKSCSCAYDGEQYCPQFEGDEFVQNIVPLFNLIANYSTSNCNSLVPTSYACFALSDNVTLSYYLRWSYLNYQYNYGTWQTQYDAPECIYTTFLLDYSLTALQMFGNSSSLFTCPIYTCSSYTSGWSTNQCIYNSENVYYSALFTVNEIASCPTGYICEPSGNSNSTCVKNVTQGLLPGQYCTNTSECYGNYECSSNRCKGLADGSSCATGYCDVGLYCNATDKVCKSTVSTGKSCVADNQCGVYAVCFNKACVKYYSLSNGKTGRVDSGDTYGYSSVCSSGFAATFAGPEVLCTEAPMSAGKVGASCNPGDACMSTMNSYVKTCQCGFDGNSYCPSFEGDFYLQQAIINFKKLQSSSINCGADVGIDSLCVWDSSSMLGAYYNYYSNITVYQDIKYLVGKHESCVKTSYMSKYIVAIDYVQKHSPSHSWATIIAVGISWLALSF
ncbi:hypothetical protein SteCoe_31662 [Stentor coeruleus]|uniref:EGF-like domain-containing protein n=1 Tax=Stentor coeruleus TaxID=5963 RepID=A0A1R2B186_9CILI|nr:hypothetical protein SteCoe_31662 [Stentor coeruleus]